MKRCINLKKLVHLHSIIALLILAPLVVNATPRPIEQESLQASKTITGTVIDEAKEPMIGVVVKVVGTTLGTVTDIDGKYSITLPEGKTELEFTFLSYDAQTVVTNGKNVINIQLQPKSQQIAEFVVVGYGTQLKKDLTGTVTSVGTKDFNPGLINSPEQLINGKVAGVQIMSNSGSPSAGSTIRVRGGASLNASNDPLIVLDGVPLESGGISGNSSNFLSLINPNDIESMSVLKDASSTAIYGSRASNGVIIITTKKGSSNKLNVSFSSTLSLQNKTRVAETLSSQQFRDLITERGNTQQKSLLGDYSTNWNDEIYKTAFGTDNNLSVAGGFSKTVPFRFSVGFYDQDGILRTDNTKRYTGSAVVSPSFFEDHLKFNFNVKGSINKNSFANTTAIWNAAAFNPTQPVYSGNDAFGGFYESLDNTGVPATGALLNPVGLLFQEEHFSTVKRTIGNMDVDYKLHFLPELKAHLTLGYDYAKGEGTNYIPAEAAFAYKVGGTDNEYSQEKINKLFTGYLNYNKNLKSIKSTLDVTAGYDYQYWRAKSPQFFDTNVAGEVVSTSAAQDQTHVLISFYGRVNYSYDSKYLFTGTIRRDGSSRFNPDNRWGVFPSAAVAWRASQEPFLVDNPVVSDLKVRLSYGVTGQQDGIGNYSYLPIYTLSNDYAQYQFGNNFYHLFRPTTYISDLKWETTSSYNAGFDFGFLNNRINGTFDYYNRKTKDLLATVAVPAGTNFSETATTNVGNVESNGLEFALNFIPVDNKDMTWSFGFNATYQKVKITNLTLVKDANSPGSYTGPTVGGQGLQILTEGYAPNMFYVYKQIYDESGKPLEGMFADLNGDGVINEKDLYRYHSPMPDYLLGFNSQFRYQKWSLGFVLRASIGNYVYNNMAASLGAWETMQYVTSAINNLSTDFLNTGFQTRQYRSDYYVQNASFLKMDNISLGYNVGKVFRGPNMRVGALIQNVFTITKYKGVDPEILNGFDSQFYPRPRIFSLSVNLDF